MEPDDFPPPPIIWYTVEAAYHGPQDSSSLTAFAEFESALAAWLESRSWQQAEVQAHLVHGFR